MKFNWKQIVLLILMSSTILIAVPSVAIVAGFSFGFTRSNNMRELLKSKQASVPTQILDRKGRLITELVGEQKRDTVFFHDLPIEIVTALMSREDPKYFFHSGFTVKATLRAFLFAGNRGGGSSITQQTAGVKFLPPGRPSAKDKVIELWYAFNLERDLSKQEIIQVYLNEVYFGHGAYGIEAASQFFFGHSANELTLAESAIVVTPISNPTVYSPLRNPKYAKQRQESVLQRMTDFGYIEKEEADKALEQFWVRFDKTRSPDETYRDLTLAQNKAPYFTDYIKDELRKTLTGTADIYRDGYIVETTLDLDLQKKAEEAIVIGLDYAEMKLSETKKNRGNDAAQKYIPIIDMICLSNNIAGLDNYQARKEKRIINKYVEEKSPTVSLLSLLTGNMDLQEISRRTNTLKSVNESKNQVQTSMITLENDTGRILTMIGGRDYDVQFESAIFNRATQSEISPGSCIKPLYYSAGISTHQITPATIFDDAPAVFYLKGAEPFMPDNYMDKWKGPVRVRWALKKSMNIPSIKILDLVGFDKAIERIAALTGMSDKENDQSYFPRKYPLALGTIKTTPLNMGRAFATFANNGVSSEPHGIMAIKDRNGNPLGEYGNLGINLEQQVTDNREDYRILTPEEAYIMVDMLKSTITSGTLYYRGKEHDFFDGMAMAGKTGTTQNWEDSWAIGFSPYMTTAVWFGHDQGNQSLGTSLSGASLAGRSWGSFMSNAHKELPRKEFYEPDQGIVKKLICSKTGKLARSTCADTLTEVFLEGTEPTHFCQRCAREHDENRAMQKKLELSRLLEQTQTAGSGAELEELDIDALIRENAMSDPDKYKNINKETEDPENIEEENNTEIDFGEGLFD